MVVRRRVLSEIPYPLVLLPAISPGFTHHGIAHMSSIPSRKHGSLSSFPPLLRSLYRSRKGFFSETGRRGGTDLTARTRIFSPLAVRGLCVAIGRYWDLFKRLTAVPAGRFYRFEHIETYSSGKVVAKSECQQSSSCCRSHRPTEDQTVLFGSPE